jgi:hypothetical protein
MTAEKRGTIPRHLWGVRSPRRVKDAGQSGLGRKPQKVESTFVLVVHHLPPRHQGVAHEADCGVIVVAHVARAFACALALQAVVV